MCPQTIFKFSDEVSTITSALLCRRTVVLSYGGPQISPYPRKIMCIRENSSIVCQIQRVNIRQNTAYPRRRKCTDKPV